MEEDRRKRASVRAVVDPAHNDAGGDECEEIANEARHILGEPVLKAPLYECQRKVPERPDHSQEKTRV